MILNMTDPWLYTEAIISINHKWFHSVRIIVNTFACKCFSPWMCFRPYSAEHKRQRKTLVKPWCSMSELLLTNNLKAFKLFCLLDYFFKWKTNFLFLMDFFLLICYPFKTFCLQHTRLYFFLKLSYSSFKNIF